MLNECASSSMLETTSLLFISCQQSPKSDKANDFERMFSFSHRHPHFLSVLLFFVLSERRSGEWWKWQNAGVEEQCARESESDTLSTLNPIWSDFILFIYDLCDETFKITQYTQSSDDDRVSLKIRSNMFTGHWRRGRGSEWGLANEPSRRWRQRNKKINSSEFVNDIIKLSSHMFPSRSRSNENLH